VTKADGKIQIAKLARNFHRLAEILGQGSEVALDIARGFDALAEGESVDMATGNKRRTFVHVPAPTNVSTEERTDVLQALRNNELRRRAARG
jgi:hypothetical protein